MYGKVEGIEEKYVWLGKKEDQKLKRGGQSPVRLCYCRRYFIVYIGLVERINGFQIEPPTLFKGRGAHPKAGILKPRIQPE